MIAYFTELFGSAFGPVIGLAIVFVLLALGIWILFMVVRKFRSGLFVSGSAKGRAPRLAVVDAVPVDSHRRLILVRRDNIEHLIMIGGPTDIVVEAGIGKPQPAIQSAPAATPNRIPAQASEAQLAVQPAPSQRTATMAARDAVTEAERGRPVRTPEANLAERRTETPFVQPVTPSPEPPAPPQQATANKPAFAQPAGTNVTPQRSASEVDLDKLLDELRPNPLQDR